MSHHVLRPGDLTATLEGQPLVHPALSCVLVAAACGREAGVVAMDSLVHRGLVTCEELVEIVESGRVRRGVRAARVAVHQVDPACESPGESLLRCRLHDLGLPFDTQVAISTRGRDYRVDFLVRGRTILEFDGRVKYGGADGADALVREKRREDELRLEGFGFLRVVWRDLDNLAALAAAIDRASLRADTLESPRHAEDF